MVENLSLIRLAIALGLMSYAAVSDWKTRKAANWIWMVMGGIGMVLLLIDLLYYDSMSDASLLLVDGSLILDQSGVYNWAYYLIFIPIGIFFFDVFWDREPVYHEGKIEVLPLILYAIAFSSMAIMVYIEGFTDIIMVLLSVPILIIVFIIFYYARLIHGGADAKAFMALAILFPYYPVIFDFPLIEGPNVFALNVAFPFSPSPS